MIRFYSGCSSSLRECYGCLFNSLPVLKATTTYLFVLFSHVLWPVFVPFSISLLERVVWRKKRE